MNYYGNDGRYIVAITNIGEIYEMSSGRKGQKIGFDVQYVDGLNAQITEMEAILNEYKAKLIELGVITPEKSPEEIAKEAAEKQLELVQSRLSEQAEVNNALLDAIKELKGEIKGLKGKRTRGSDGKFVKEAAND